MNIEKALEIATAIRRRNPSWTAITESGSGMRVHLIVTNDDQQFVIRWQGDKLVVSGMYGNLSKYIHDGDTLPRLGLPIDLPVDMIAQYCEMFELEMADYAGVLGARMVKAKGDYESRLEVANKLSHPGIKITNATDIWWQKKRFEVSGEILSGGNVSLSIMCDSDTANMILELLKGVK